MYRIMALDAYDLSETEYEVGRFEEEVDARLYIKELKYENRQLVSEMRDYGYTTFYRVEEVRPLEVLRALERRGLDVTWCDLFDDNE